MRFEKGEKKFGKRRQKSTCLTIYATETNAEGELVFIFDNPNHTLVGGVSVKFFETASNSAYPIRMSSDWSKFSHLPVDSFTVDTLGPKTAVMF